MGRGSALGLCVGRGALLVVGQRGLGAVRVGQGMGRGAVGQTLVVKGGGLATLREASIVRGCGWRAEGVVGGEVPYVLNIFINYIIFI